MEPCKMLWADPCCHGNDIWPRRGDVVAYQLVISLLRLYRDTWIGSAVRPHKVRYIRVFYMHVYSAAQPAIRHYKE